MTKQDYKITRKDNGVSEIEVSHQGGRITFVYPAKGPESYVNVHEQITGAGLIAPTMAQTASLVHTAHQNSKEREFAHILDILDNKWLWMFTGNRYIQYKGVYIVDNPGIADGKVVIESELELQKKVEAGNRTVRFVQYGFKTGQQTELDLARNRFVIGLAGKEGAEKLADISERYKPMPPYVWSFADVDKETVRVSCLDGYYNGHRLSVGGDSYGDNIYGSAFGICETMCVGE